MVGNHDGTGSLRADCTDRTASLSESRITYAALLTCLPEALCLIQGDELGLPGTRIRDHPEDGIRIVRQALIVLPGSCGSHTPWGRFSAALAAYPRSGTGFSAVDYE